MTRELVYRLTASASGKKKGVLHVQVNFKGDSTHRAFLPIKGLTVPDMEYWNVKEQRFDKGSVTAIQNNPVLDDVCARCDALLTNPAITTPQEFIDALKCGSEPSKTITLGDFVRTEIYQQKHVNDNNKPTGSYHSRINFLNKLEREKTARYKGKIVDLIDVPIEEVDDACFEQYGKYILSLPNKEGRTNYDNLMITFQAVVSDARGQHLTKTMLTYRYADFKPSDLKKPKEKLPPLTLNQYDQFVRLDVNLFPVKGRLSHELMGLYRDICIFLYETRMRPADVVKARYDCIKIINGKPYYCYVPEKKKNYKKIIVVKTLLNENALRIIGKYKGMSSKGYIFPFSMNEKDWNLSDKQSWNTWRNRQARVQDNINKWLKQVAALLGWKIKVTLYTFRRTTLTHACMAANANLMEIALSAGTSVKMLQDHYVSNTVDVNGQHDDEDFITLDTLLNRALNRNPLTPINNVRPNTRKHIG